MQSILVDNGDGSGSISVYIDGELLGATSEHPYYDAIVKGAQNDDYSIVDLFDISRTVAKRFESLSERVSVANGGVYFDGDEMDNALTQTILRFVEQGKDYDWKPLVAFFEKVMTNPNNHSREQLFYWLDNRDFTITTEGNIVMYKGVQNDLLSVHAGGRAIVDGQEIEGKIPNQVGSTVEMPRESVQHDPRNGCSVGLHAATMRYALTWGATRIAVIVNPRDVVSVPTDCNAEKIRCCRYKVQAIVNDVSSSLVLDEDDEDDWDF